MKNLYLFIFAVALFSSANAVAEPIAAIGSNLVFESGSDGRSMERRQPVSLRGGYRFELADAYLEFTDFRASEGSSNLYVSREHSEFILWGRKIFRDDWPVSPYFAAGAGVQYEQITTTLGTEKSDDTGSPQAMGAAALGVRVVILKNLDAQLESRLSVSPATASNPLLGFGLVLGLAF